MSENPKTSETESNKRSLNVEVIEDNKNTKKKPAKKKTTEKKSAKKKSAKKSATKVAAKPKKEIEVKATVETEKEIEVKATPKEKVEVKVEEKTKVEEKIEEAEIKEQTESKSEPKGKVEEKAEAEVKLEEKVEEKAKEKVEEKVEEKAEEKVEEKIEEKAEEKVEEKIEEKAEEKVEEKVEPEPETKEEKAEESIEEKKEIKAEEKIEEEAETEAKPEENIEEKVEEKTEPEVVLNVGAEENSAKPEVILPEKSDDSTYFETLSLNTEIKKPKSRIIKRDVAKTDEEIEAQATIKPDKTRQAQPHIQRKIDTVTQSRTARRSRRFSAKELKEQEIKKAIDAASRLPQTSKKRTRKPTMIGRLGWARWTLIITCTATAVFSLIYFLDMTSTDISLKVVATQSGIEASYPDYVPRGYELSDVSSASGKVTMNYKSDEGSFTITEESSNWDSNALLNNYIRERYTTDEYSVIAEQGLTIYMGNRWEAWVSGGLLYKLEVKSGSLTKKQLKAIATSLLK